MTSTTGRGHSGADLDRLAQLEEQRAFLLRSLDDLDRELAAGDIDDADYRALRNDYTARAAATIRAIEAGREVLPAPPPRSSRRRLAIVAGVLVFALAAGGLVAASVGERRPDEVATGDIRRTSSDLLLEARTLFNQGELVPAIEAYDEVLTRDPENPEALAYRGFLLVTVGSEAGARLGASGDDLVGEGLALLGRALEQDPDYLDARIFRAMAHLYVVGDPEAALVDVRAALDADPPPDVVPRLAELHADIEEALASASR